jgi:hypothetical protein
MGVENPPETVAVEEKPLFAHASSFLSILTADLNLDKVCIYVYIEIYIYVYMYVYLYTRICFFSYIFK